MKERWQTELSISNTHLNAVTRYFQKLSIRYTNPGSIVVPGLSDSHGHILEHGKNLELNLDGLSSPQGKFLEISNFQTTHLFVHVAEAVKRIRDYIKARPDILNDPEAWIDGGGWDHTSWPGSRWPTSV